MTEYEINSKDYTVEYDLDNRIVKVEVDNDDVEYRYDAFGRRVIRKEGSTNTSLIWWGNSECAEHKHQAGTTVIQNDIMEHPSRLNSVIARAKDGSKFKLEWYHKNYLDHVYAVSDDSGDLLEHYRYTAFGEVTIYDQNGAQVTETQIDNHILWNTRRRDEVTGYYMYKYRHYAPELGRWPSRDPIEEKGGINLYAFVGNDGINRWDALGLQAGDSAGEEYIIRIVEGNLKKLKDCLEKNKQCPEKCRKLYRIYIKIMAQAQNAGISIDGLTEELFTYQTIFEDLGVEDIASDNDYIDSVISASLPISSLGTIQIGVNLGVSGFAIFEDGVAFHGEEYAGIEIDLDDLLNSNMIGGFTYGAGDAKGAGMGLWIGTGLFGGHSHSDSPLGLNFTSGDFYEAGAAIKGGYSGSAYVPDSGSTGNPTIGGGKGNIGYGVGAYTLPVKNINISSPTVRELINLFNDDNSTKNN